MHDTLGAYIRAHRERTLPVSVGITGGGRRRTPGLRREELAQLCQVSPTWLTWLEQGRPVQASAGMLARLAEVLQLSAAERAYLFSLADRLDPQQDADDDNNGEALALNAIVAAIAGPAYILDRQWDALAWNGAAAQLFVGWLDQAAATATPPNLLRFMFGDTLSDTLSDTAAQALIVDWPTRARRLVAEFRADCGRHVSEPALAWLIGELSAAHTSFRLWWNLQDVVGREGGLRRFRHPQLGELAYHQVTLHLAKRHDLKLVMLLPTSLNVAHDRHNLS